MMKRKISAILAVLLILALFIPAMASAETVKLAYKGGALNIRSGAGTGYESVGYVHNGDHITVMKWGDVWSKIKTSGGKTGYIKNLYISGSNSSYASGTTYFDSGRIMYTTASVNFRAGASTETKSMGTLAKGTKLTALGKNGSFYLVKNSKGTQGFVSGNYLSKTKPGSASSSSSTEKTKVVTASYVNMRKGGGLSYDVIRVLKKGTEVKVFKKGNYWTQVEYKGDTGWIKNTYLK